MVNASAQFLSGLVIAMTLAKGVARAEDPHAADLIRPGQKQSNDQIRRDRVRQVFLRGRAQGPAPEVVYGNDDRLDRYQVAEPERRAMGEAVCSMTTASNVVSNGDGTYRLLDVARFTSVSGTTLCQDEAFRGQLQLGFCTGFLVGEDLIATAGHCVDGTDVAFIFGFDQSGPGLSGPPDEIDPIRVPGGSVYFATQIVDRVFAGDVDYAIVRLDRPVPGRQPLPVRRAGEPGAGDPLLLIGHGNNLPSKFDAGGHVRGADPTRAFFTADLDSFGGNSGSPVINRLTGVVEGILVRGSSDFVVSGGCVRSRECADTGCPGFEEITRSSVFAQNVPQIGGQVSPLGGIASIGPVGGPFSAPSVTYTLSNTSSVQADYIVSVDAGGGVPLLLDAGPGPVGGSLAPGATTSVSVSIAPTASLLPAGSYQSVVRVVDTTNATQALRTQRLDVGTSGFVVTPSGGVALSGVGGGPFVGTRVFTVTSTGATPVQVGVQGDQSWLAIDGGASQSFTLGAPGASRVVAVGVSGDAAGLGAGVYSGVVNFTNQSGGTGSVSRPATLEVGRVNYLSSGAGTAVPDRGASAGTIYVPDGWCIGDVDVDVDVEHGFIGDLILELVSPAGTSVRLHNRTGGDGVNLVGTFDQQHAPGRLIPDGPGSLSEFNGQSALGAWMLRVTDNASGHAGRLNSWAVRIVPASGCAPIATAQTLSVLPTVTSSIGLSSTSFSQAPVSYRVMSLPAHGKLFDPVTGLIGQVPHDVELGGVEVRYRPDLGHAGADSFTFAAVEGGVLSAPASVGLSVGVDVPAAAFGFVADPGWDCQGLWQFGKPTGNGTTPGDPASGFVGDNVVGYNLQGDYPGGLAQAQYVTTSAVDLSGVALPRIELRRWLGVERNAFDRATIEASIDGGQTWTTIWMNPDTTLPGGDWEQMSVALPPGAGGKPDVRVRWGMGPTDAIANYPGWNIDDVRFYGLAAPNPPCEIDLNADGLVDLADFFTFFTALDQALPEGDVNADGWTDLDDFVSFFNFWDQGGCGPS